MAKSGESLVWLLGVVVVGLGVASLDCASGPKPKTAFASIGKYPAMDLTVMMNTDDPPCFSWSGGDKVNRFGVSEQLADDKLSPLGWIVTPKDEDGTFEGPVCYGAAPSGAKDFQGYAARPLEAGKTYVVTVGFDPVSPGAGTRIMGRANFTYKAATK